MGKDKKKEKKRDRSSDRDESSTREDKKARKKAEKVAKALGYSNETNPFGDSNLLNPFAWGKKKEKDAASGASKRESADTRLSLMKDIERVRERRRQREQEVEEMERLRAEEQRLREAALYGDWQDKEDDFHIQQTQVRSKLRLVEDRRKPIDIIAQGIILIETFESSEEVPRIYILRTFLSIDPLFHLERTTEMLV